MFKRLCGWFCSSGELPGETGPMRLIVGLGNPGAAYAGTRHNAGFEVVDLLAGRLGADVRRKKFGGLVGECTTNGRRVVLVKPQEYMNRSGEVAATVVGFHKVSLSDLMVVADDLALEPGRIRMRAGGSAGGHNGLKDIIRRLGTEEFGRLRVGVGGQGAANTKDYVLSRPSKGEREAIEHGIAVAVEALSCWLDEGIDAAMSRYNVRKTEGD